MAITLAPPIEGSDQARLMNVDALRGFALFGILVVNVWVFANGYYGSGAHDPAFDSGVDRGIQFLVSSLFEVKFYLLFSFLFGYSFTLQMASAERDGTAFHVRMLRRLAGLFGLGLVHGLLLYHGDILMAYALLGLILLGARGLAPGRAVTIGFVLILVAGLVWTLLGIVDWTSGRTTDPATVHIQVEESTRAFRDSAGTVIGEHAARLPETMVFVLLVQAPSALAMFLFGLAAGKVELFANPDAYRRLGTRVLTLGLPVGLAGALIWANATTFHPGSGMETFGLGLGLLTAPLLTAAYVVVALRSFHTFPGQRVAVALAPLGRTALSNYLLQSLVCGILFTGYGFGLMGRLAPAAVLTMVVAIFIGQLLLSRYWLRNHHYGPAEWLLRALTKGSWPAWSKRERRQGMQTPT